MIDDKAVIEFLRKSYFAADGLWFMRVEDEHSYEEALRIDEQVWDILPKIQARKARELLGIEGGSLDELAQGLRLKFLSEGYEHSVAEQSSSRLHISISECPWLNLMKKSGRMSKAAEICDRVCARDFAVWASQFSQEIEFSMGENMADGASSCALVFARRDGTKEDVE